MQAVLRLIAGVLALSLLTAETAEKRPAKPKGPRVLLFGGGSSHDYNKFFNEADTATINGTGKAIATYTDKPADIPALLKDTDVLCLSANLPLDTNAESAIMAFAQAKKGVVLVHAGTWYNWKEWPEFNQQIVTGGTRGHDKLGEFEVVVTKARHAVMKGVPKFFKITDELYNFLPDPASGGREVLATATSPNTKKTFPIVWITKAPKARIVCITLGHDARAHNLPAYKTLLNNSIQWAAKTK